MHTSRFPFY